MQRIKLADEPLGIVGDELNGLVRSVEKVTFERRAQDPTNQSKDARGVVFVRAPPRHGKSLLLDRIFVTDPNTAVITITFNSDTSISSTSQLGSGADAGGWQIVARIFMRLFGISRRDPCAIISSLKTQYFSAERVWEKLLKFIRSHTSYHKIENVAIAMDEISNMTDLMTKEQAEALGNFLDNQLLAVSAEAPQCGIVATAFTTKLTRSGTRLSGVLKEQFELSWLPPLAGR